MIESVMHKMEAESKRLAEENSYLGEDGLLYCSTCHEPRQARMDLPFFGNNKVVGVVCKCVVARKKAEQEAQKEIQIENNRSVCFEYERKNKTATFAVHDNSNPRIMQACKDYVNDFSEIKLKKIGGVLLYGNFGTGKSFLAANIANAVIDQGFTALMINIIDLIGRVKDFDTSDSAIDEIATVNLLIIDDIGAERSTEFSLEQVYRIINTRYQSELPTVFTTNLSLDEIENPKETQYKRIYDRIDEMTPIKLKMVGESKRKAERNSKRQQAIDVMYGDKNV